MSNIIAYITFKYHKMRNGTSNNKEKHLEYIGVCSNWCVFYTNINKKHSKHIICLFYNNPLFW